MDLHAIDEALFDIWLRVWNLKWLRPTNLEEEKRRFFATEATEPVFEYRALDFDVKEYISELYRIERILSGREGAIAVLLAAKATKLRSWLRMLETRGTPGFTEHALAYYGKPSPELVRKARLLLGAEETLPERPLDAEQAAARLREMAADLGLDWRVAVKRGLASRADCVIPERTLYLRADARFSERDIRKLALHELGVHARRAENGSARGYLLFLMGTAGYETTEEGLAGFVEEQAGLATRRSMLRKALLVLIVDKALRQGFREVFAFVRQHLPEDSAFRLVVKAKRGLGDTGEPGAFTKDHIYLKGLELVRALTDEQREGLFLGRIAAADLELLS